MVQLRKVQYERYESVLKEIGTNIRRIRKAKAMSMEQVALKADIDFRQLGRIERGEGNITIISLLRIAEVLENDLIQFVQ